MKRLITFWIIACALTPTAVAQTQPATAGAQTPAARPAQARVLGEVVAVDRGGRKVTLRTDAGRDAAVEVDEKTVYRRLAPGEVSLDKATAGSLEEIGVGDRLLARGSGAAEALRAREVVIMSKGDLALKRERDRAEWQRRGIIGRVTAVNPEKKEITLLAQTRAGSAPVTVTVKETTTFRRYAPDSIRYRDAVESTFAALKVGDQLRALGERSADGTSFVPEEIVSGTFLTAVGTVKAVNAQTGELTVVDAQTQKPLTVVVNKDSKLRRLPSEVVKVLEQRIAGDASAQKADGEDVQETIDRLPATTVADLKPGDAVIVSSTVGADASRVTAIVVASGAEPLVRRLQRQPERRDLNLGLGLPSGVNP